MRVPLSWLTELVPEVAAKTPQQVADLLDDLGIEVDEVGGMGPSDIDGLRVGEVTEIEELTGFKKPIRFTQVRFGDGPDDTRGIVCGATNFAVGDRVVAALPGAVLPGDFHISARKTYGRVSDGMICSAREMGLGDEHDGILVLPEDAPVGADAVDYLGLHQTVFVTEPTPDRGYQLSMRGIGREIAAGLRVPYVDPLDAAGEPELAEGFPVELESAACDRFSTRIIRGFDPQAPSPDWMQQRLTAAGMRPISLAVDVTNYVMLLTGQPLHAYDLDKLSGRIVVRMAREGESIVTLDDVRRPLAAGEDLLITDDAAIQGLAGVMGAEWAEISHTTSNILLEAAHFEPRTISRTARRHGLITEAGKRFERGVDPLAGPAAIELSSRLLVEFGGGTPEPTSSVGEPALPQAHEVDVPAISALIGVEYADETVVDALRAVGCTVAGSTPTLTVTPPSWRPDFVEPNRFAEEVARIDGYDNIPSVLPKAQAGRGLTPAQRARRWASRALGYAGFVETPSMSFQDDADLDRMKLPADDGRRRTVALANPISAEQRTLRSTLLPGLLAAVRRNVSRGARDVAVFETGTVFFEKDDPRPSAPQIDVGVHPSDTELVALEAALPIERLHAAVALTGDVTPTTWFAGAQPASWRDAVEAAREVADSVGATVTVEAASRAPWHPGRCAEIQIPDGAVVGYAGELHPAVCDALEVPRRTAVAELNLGALIAAGEPVTGPPDVSPYPRAVQDLAVLADADLPAAALLATIRQAGGELLEDVDVFDVYTGEQVGEGKRSVAFALSLRAPDRTLSHEETTAVRQAIIDALAAEHNAVLR